jgi:hypothetical protein
MNLCEQAKAVLGNAANLLVFNNVCPTICKVARPHAFVPLKRNILTKLHYAQTGKAVLLVYIAT